MFSYSRRIAFVLTVALAFGCGIEELETPAEEEAVAETELALGGSCSAADMALPAGHDCLAPFRFTPRCEEQDPSCGVEHPVCEPQNYKPCHSPDFRPVVEVAWTRGANETSCDLNRSWDRVYNFTRTHYGN